MRKQAMVADRVLVGATDDPVLVADNSVTRPAGATPTAIDSRSEAADLADSLGIASVVASWRVGPTWYDLGDVATYESGEPLAANILDALEPLDAAAVSTLVIADITDAPTSSDQGDGPSYPVSPEATERIDRFFRSVPADFQPSTDDPPTPLDQGISVRARSDTRDAWIELQLAPSIVGGSTPSQPEVIDDRGSSRMVRWRSTSGWSYLLSIGSTSDQPVPFDDAEIARWFESIDPA
jgi:hypothetical protein